MPIHDWLRVPNGICHSFHHLWISSLCDALNGGLLPGSHYAILEPVSAGLGVNEFRVVVEPADGSSGMHSGTSWLAPGERFPRMKSWIAVRHVDGDRLVSIVEIVTPGNKLAAGPVRELVDRVGELLERRVHLLLIDIFPPGVHDSDGLHAMIWQKMCPTSHPLPAGKSLAVVSYEWNRTPRAYLEPLAVGDPLPEMPLFIQAGRHISIPLEAPYVEAFKAMPRRWRDVLQPPAA